MQVETTDKFSVVYILVQSKSFGKKATFRVESNQIQKTIRRKVAMTKMKEISGKTVDEATETALKEMGVVIEEIDIKVDNPGRSGIMGFGGEPAEITVTLLKSKKHKS